MKRFVLRYGLLSVLLIMAVGFVSLFGHLTTRTKASATLFVTGSQTAVVYVSGADPRAEVWRQRRICIEQTLAGAVTCVVDSVSREPDFLLLHVSVGAGVPLRERLGGNTCSPGYIFTGREHFGQVLLKHLKA